MNTNTLKTPTNLNGIENQIKQKFFIVNTIIIVTGIIIFFVLLKNPHLFVTLKGARAQKTISRTGVLYIVAGPNEMYWFDNYIAADKTLHIKETHLDSNGINKILKIKSDYFKNTLIILIKPSPDANPEIVNKIIAEINKFSVKRYAVLNFTPLDESIFNAYRKNYKGMTGEITITGKQK